MPSSSRSLTLYLLSTAVSAAWAAAPHPSTQFNDSTEFVGLAPVSLAAARAQVPQRYTVVDAGGSAQLVVRVADCRSVQVGRLPARPGRVAQIGIIIQSPDGTAVDPATSINNYTLSYASNSLPLVLALRAAGVPAMLDTAMAIESTPVTGGNEFYAAITPELGSAPAWFLHGKVQAPAVPTSFLANWWRLNGNRATKMATDIPAISFDFTSVVSFSTSRQGVVGTLLGSNQVANFPVSFRGAFSTGTMLTTVGP